MKDEIITALARLASLAYQRRYIVDGTVDAYVLPEELLEDIDGLVPRAKRPENLAQFSCAQMSALDELMRFIDEHSGEALGFSSAADAADKILGGATWSELRSKASDALAEFGQTIDAISVEQIDEGRIAASS